MVKAKTKTLTVPSTGKDMEQLEHIYMAGGMQSSLAILGKKN